MNETHGWTATTTVPIRKPTVLMDCDGVLSDFTSACLEIVFKKTGVRYQPEDIKTWEIFDSIKEKNIRGEVYDAIKEKDCCRNLAVFTGAFDAVQTLKQHTELVIVTSPFYGSPTWAHEREKWLEDNMGINARDVIHARKKFHIAGDCLIDDRMENLVLWKGRFPNGYALLWSTPHNLQDSAPGISRIQSWAQLLEVVLQGRNA